MGACDGPLARRPRFHVRELTAHSLWELYAAGDGPACRELPPLVSVVAPRPRLRGGYPEDPAQHAGIDGQYQPIGKPYLAHRSTPLGRMFRSVSHDLLAQPGRRAAERKPEDCLWKQARCRVVSAPTGTVGKHDVNLDLAMACVRLQNCGPGNRAIRRATLATLSNDGRGCRPKASFKENFALPAAVTSAAILPDRPKPYGRQPAIGWHTPLWAPSRA